MRKPSSSWYIFTPYSWQSFSYAVRKLSRSSRVSQGWARAIFFTPARTISQKQSSAPSL